MKIFCLVDLTSGKITMKKWNFSVASLCFVMFASGSNGNSMEGRAAFTSWHSDYRKTPKFEEFSSSGKSSNRDPEQVARTFLASKAKTYGFDRSSKDELRLVEIKDSLFGKHFYFQQFEDGVEVKGGEVIVSVGDRDRSVYQSFNNFYTREKVESKFTKSMRLKADAAYDIAWQDLKVHGILQDAPKQKLTYSVTEKGEFRLVYVTYLNTSAPFGAWEHEIDAYTGKVLSRTETSIDRKGSKKNIDPSQYKGAVVDRKSAFKDYEKSTARHSLIDLKDFRLANGSGLVFDPDPRTTLNDETLQDDSVAKSFDAAYFERDLLDLSFDGSVYKLEGPWAKIKDFESPTLAPSTSTTGKWDQKRGNNSFNDAMTYYHIDKNQRYMQSLGFEGSKAIQGAPIEIDTHGVGGADNSHFIPASNRLAFGHGCVDDNEDADVILHEYGHAINYSINRNWSGGDSGAMGEGFGDYWAASYSVSFREGQSYKPNEVFTWDGHGEGSPCWDGRVLNATEMQYDHTRKYGAHQRIGNRQSDELWSTPLFQSLLELMEQGVPREELDQIVLEAQFGLGAGLKMRDLAQATISTARRLQPKGPHADVLQSKFAAQKIVVPPTTTVVVK